jgi:hypothetical protein
MNLHAGNFRSQLVEQVRALSANSKSGAELIQALDGVHPIDVKDVLVAAGEMDLVERLFRDLAISRPAFREMRRDDNPVLSFWPFTPDCAQQIADLVPDSDSVALLGAPTIFSVLNERRIGRAILFDNDDYLFSQEATHGYVRCDVLSNVLLPYENQFDLIVGDPPWYFEEYCSWLLTAIGLARPGGTIVFVLFPPNIRNTAANERDEILALARKTLSDVEILPIPAAYETPSFEQIELIQNGIAPINWRRAQLMSGKVPPNKAKFVPSKRSGPSEVWTERRVGCGRIFAKNVPNIPVFLETADANSRFLSSPSTRNLARTRSNVISSRGHGLRCNDTELLLTKLENLRDARDICNIGVGLDQASASLLKSVADDLWPRFITI